MDSARRPISRLRDVALLGLVASAWHAAGCTSQNIYACRPKTADELRTVAEMDIDCQTIRVHETDLSSLAGLERMHHPKLVELYRNSALTDISAADGARGLAVTRNVRVDVLDITLHNELSIGTTDIGEWNVQFEDPIFPDPEDPMPDDGIVYVDFSGTRGTIDLSCAPGACRAWFAIGDTQEDLVIRSDLDAERLHMGAPITSTDFLHPIGVPRELRVSERSLDARQDLEVLRDYRAWLDENGFDGTFVYCAFSNRDGADQADADCQEITAGP